ncbi:hypothetical protein HHK36_005473 [Tetracentron sinense]|uniref:non-specific serine/threonine protein kinase n=1 Tax=Tetracentron sinense TaxID=13715 RepID=A0A835DR22_TETSI|nr:hypothetical protein HHK36_005473 [Tetracentron sinense]
MANNFRTPTFFLSSLVLFSYSLIVFSNAANTIKQGQSIGDGETVISSGENFVLGFFSPENSTNRYVGIWYNKVSIQTVVWVANRENPISDTTGVLTIGEDGNLVVLNGSRNPIWSTNASISSNTTATLMDSGNLVLASSDNMTHPGIWESFEYPTDTFLPGMRVTDKHIFVSWKSANDPAKGNYSMGVDLQGSLQIVIWEGSKRIWRSGQWNGLTFAGVPNTRALYLYGFKVTNDEREGKMYLTYTMLNSSEILKFRINWNGSEEQRSWDEERKEWSLVMSQPSNKCEVYNKCGNFGSCSITDSPICICVEGFKPKFIEEWNRGNWSGGCVRKTQLQCQRNSSVEAAKEDGFLKFKRMKLPDFGDSVTVQDTDECEAECLKNCSCGAYAYVIGMGCMIWGRDLVDLQHFQQFGSSLFIRLADSELDPWKKGSKEQSLFVLSKSREFSSHFSGPDDLAWNLWNEGKAMEFMDTSISFSEFEVLRCIHVALLCVQDSAMERPTMSSVILMLESETASLPRPKQPTFTIVRNHTEMDLCTESPEIVSANDVTVTMVFGR